MNFIAIISYIRKYMKKMAFFATIMLFAGAAYAETAPDREENVRDVPPRNEVAGTTSAEATHEPGWVPQLLGLQATVIYQNMPAFPSPYEGPHSLEWQNGEGHGNTETYGIYLGSRLAPLLQTYLDIEMARGHGIGNALGLGGITNGDVIRQGSSDLGQDPYIARFYMRYLIPLSQETVTVERSMDQLPGVEPASRIEIKAGKLAATDDFDLNRYANTTRTQFMNWGLINNTAWDFAADTRGYTYGILIAVTEPSWKLALGLYQVATTANGNDFDSHLLDAHGENLELTVKPNQLGTVVRLLVYRNLGRMGDYAEATAIGQQTSSTPNITADEHLTRYKYGFGLNVEQPLADDGDTGLFLRAGWNDGHTEDFMFTEVDQDVSIGTQVSGSHWGRQNDRFGAAYVWHWLSDDHRDYLAAGGVGFLLGDGKLNYEPEQIFETYYLVQLGRYAQLSPDFQFIQNPGYNHDRGPVEVYSLRFRLSY